MRSSDEKYVQKILAYTKNTQERKIKKSFTGPYESEGRGFESLPAHQGHLRLQVTFFVYMLQSYDTVVQHTFAILTNAAFIRENSE